MSGEPVTKKIKLDSVRSISSPIHAVESDETESPVTKVRSDGKIHVEKGSLKLEDLIDAKNKAKNKSKDDMTDDDKKEERRAANRLSAFQSRQRRKIIIEGLQKTVAQLSRDNSDQRQTIAELKVQLDGATKENEFLRSQLVASRGLPTQSIQTSQNQLLALLG